MRIARTSLVSAKMIGSLLATGGAASALPALSDSPSTSAVTGDPVSPQEAPVIDNFDLISQLDALGYVSHTSVIDGVVVHFYENDGMELAVPEVAPGGIQARVGGGFDWGGPYVRLNRGEQEWFVGIGVSAAAGAISAAFPPAAPVAAGVAWAVINYVQKNGACRGDMRIHFPNSVSCE